MNYKTRFLERQIVDATRRFPVVVVTGPRQTGKTSILLKVGRERFPNLEAISFDAPSDVDAFRRDPPLFFANHPGILLLDEIQHVPDIFPYIKKEADRFPRVFRFFLSGSQVFQLMRGVSESLAGRAGVLDLWPFCLQESLGIPDTASCEDTLEFLDHPEVLEKLVGREFPCGDRQEVVPAMLKGGFPSMLVHHAGPRWLESYRRTTIQRDIRELSQVADLGRFDRFTVMLAGRSGTVINKAEFSRTLGVDNKTIDHWFSLLETSYQVVSLPSWSSNTTKRLVRRPKCLFGDIGLCLHLQGIRDARGLLNAPQFGQLFETFVLMEIRKLFGHAGRSWDGHFWRTPQGLECDLVLPSAGRLVPVEIKHGSTIRAEDYRGLEVFRDLFRGRCDHGLLISMHPRVERMAAGVWNLPLGLLLKGPGKPP